MKIDIEQIAKDIIKDGWNSNDKHIDDVIIERLLNDINKWLQDRTNEVIEKMQELEHPEPRNKAEYDERYEIGE